MGHPCALDFEGRCDSAAPWLSNIVQDSWVWDFYWLWCQGCCWWMRATLALTTQSKNFWTLRMLTSRFGLLPKRYHVAKPLLLSKWWLVCTDLCSNTLELAIFVYRPWFQKMFSSAQRWGDESWWGNPVYCERIQREGNPGVAYPLLGWCNGVTCLYRPTAEFDICSDDAYLKMFCHWPVSKNNYLTSSWYLFDFCLLLISARKSGINCPHSLA